MCDSLRGDNAYEAQVLASLSSQWSGVIIQECVMLAQVMTMTFRFLLTESHELSVFLMTTT